MAIMYRCCCCGVRAGSLVVAVWSLIAGGSSFVQSCATIAANDDASVGVRVVQGMDVSVNLLLCVAAILLIVGVVKNTKGMLIPYIVCQSMIILYYGGLAIAVVIYLCADGDFNYLNLEPPAGVDPVEWAYSVRTIYIVAVVLYALLELIQLLCLFCVISQYQEIRDGRGEGPPPPSTTIVVQQQHSGFTTNMGGYAPPTYNPAVAPPVGQTPPSTFDDQTAYYSKS